MRSKLISHFLCLCHDNGARCASAAVDGYHFENESRFGATVIAPELDEGYGLGSEKPINAPDSKAGGGFSCKCAHECRANKRPCVSRRCFLPQHAGKFGTARSPIQADAGGGRAKI